MPSHPTCSLATDASGRRPAPRARIVPRAAATAAVACALLLAACEQGTRDGAGTTPVAGAATGSTAATPSSPDSLGRRVEDAAATVRSYLAALTQRDFARAAMLWDEGADPGAGDSAAFHRAHGDTTLTAFDVGTPGAVEGAAGSRFVVVPVVVAGSTPDRPPLRLHGRVTLRRSVVDGATEAAQRWRIHRIEWSSNAKPPQP